MTSLDVVRGLIILIALADSYLLIRYRNGPPIPAQMLVIGALAWLIPVAGFFILRLFYHNALVLNQLSAYIYLIGVSSWLGIAITIARGSRGRIT